MVESAVEGAIGCRIGPVCRVLEEEDDAVEGLQGEEFRWFEGEELFKLNVLDAKVLDKRGKDALKYYTAHVSFGRLVSFGDQ